MTAAFIHQMLTDFASDIECELDVAPDVDLEKLVLLLQAVRQCRRELAIVEKRIESDVVEHADGQRNFLIPEVGAVEIRKKSARTHWDTEALVPVVVARARDERIELGSGEFESEGSAIARVLTECARLEWRLTPLRARGIDPDEYAEKEDAGWGVRVS